MSEEQARLSRLLFVASVKIGMGTERLIEVVEGLQQELTVEERALKVREGFGDVLPEGIANTCKPARFDGMCDDDWAKRLPNAADPLEPGVTRKIVCAGESHLRRRWSV